mmetsp:Transcript_34156/g.54759  ORF Transcript_34156/g.54759 Transcript_34156/m.54759 type:complete len:181 (-) Transcript_34156:5-547(-)
MLLLQNPTNGDWGPCTGEALGIRVGGTGGATLLEDDTVRRTAAAALLDQAGLGQPPDVEFMQLLPAVAESDGESVYVALVRAEHLHAGEGGFRGGGGGGGSRESRSVALDAVLRGASSGEGEDRNTRAAASLPVPLARVRRADVNVLRKFLEPWVVTTGKDPKSACKDPRVAADALNPKP